MLNKIIELSIILQKMAQQFAETGKVLLGDLAESMRIHFPLDNSYEVANEALSPFAKAEFYKKQIDALRKVAKDCLKNTLGFEAYGHSVSGLSQGDETTVTLTNESGSSWSVNKRELFGKTAESLPSQIAKARPDKDGNLNFCKSTKGAARFSGYAVKDDQENEYLASVDAVVSDKDGNFNALGKGLYKAAQHFRSGNEEKCYNIILLWHYRTGIPTQSLVNTVQARLINDLCTTLNGLAEKELVGADNLKKPVAELTKAATV